MIRIKESIATVYRGVGCRRWRFGRKYAAKQAAWKIWNRLRPVPAEILGDDVSQTDIDEWNQHRDAVVNRLARLIGRRDGPRIETCRRKVWKAPGRRRYHTRLAAYLAASWDAYRGAYGCGERYEDIGGEYCG